MSACAPRKVSLTYECMCTETISLIYECGSRNASGRTLNKELDCDLKDLCDRHFTEVKSCERLFGHRIHKLKVRSFDENERV